MVNRNIAVIGGVIDSMLSARFFVGNDDRNHCVVADFIYFSASIVDRNHYHLDNMGAHCRRTECVSSQAMVDL